MGGNDRFFGHNIGWTIAGGSGGTTGWTIAGGSGGQQDEPLSGGVGGRQDKPLLEGVRERRDEPKADQKIVIRSRVLSNSLLHTVPSSFVPHRSLPSSRFCLVT